MLGGSGADNLDGGLDDDLLISDRGPGFEDENQNGFAGFNRLAINAIFAAWTSTRSYARRVARLSAGVGAGNSARLDSTTLSSDGDVDSILGDEGTDWFWADLQDVLGDRQVTERLNRY